MQIEISVPRSEARQWLFSLKAALEADGHSVRFRLADDDVGSNMKANGPAHAILAGFEAWLYRKRSSLHAHTELPAPDVASAPADLTLALDAANRSPVSLMLVLDGMNGIEGAVPALLGGRAPFVEVKNTNGDTLARGLPAIETPDVLAAALDRFYVRLITLISLAIHRHGQGIIDEQGASLPPPSAFLARGPLDFGAAGFTNRIIRRLSGRRRRGEHWFCGIRPRQDGHTLIDDPALDGFRWLEDDGARYYADPVLFDEGGRTFLFVEEYPYATGKGVIAVCELDANGQALAIPDVIIENAGHLSYPFLFRHDGEIYMMPENANEHRLPLFRAVCFPDKWEFSHNVVEDIRLHDATMFEQDGAFWLLANTEEGGGSSWDCLSLFHAASPLGPFLPAGRNPILVDARFSRSAGPIVKVGDRLIRPVQSCDGSYGRALRLMEFGGISKTGIRQHQLALIEPKPGDGLAGIHTYALSEKFEAVDGRGVRPKG